MDVNTKKLSCLLLFVGLLFLSSCLKETAVPIASSFIEPTVETSIEALISNQFPQIHTSVVLGQSIITTAAPQKSFLEKTFLLHELFTTGRETNVERKSRHLYDLEKMSVKDLPPGDFLEQFGKDLSRDNFSVDNLRWIFDGKKITRQDLDKLRKPLLELSKEKWHALSEEDLAELIDNLLEHIFIVD